MTSQLKKRVEDHKAKKRCTTRDVVLEAIAGTRTSWDQILDDAKYFVGEVNDLFAPDESKARYVGGGDAQVQFTATPEQDKKLDEIGTKLGFDTRSTWIAPLLNAYLPGKKDVRPS